MAFLGLGKNDFVQNVEALTFKAPCSAETLHVMVAALAHSKNLLPYFKPEEVYVFALSYLDVRMGEVLFQSPRHNEFKALCKALIREYGGQAYVISLRLSRITNEVKPVKFVQEFEKLYENSRIEQSELMHELRTTQPQVGFPVAMAYMTRRVMRRFFSQAVSEYQLDEMMDDMIRILGSWEGELQKYCRKHLI